MLRAALEVRFAARQVFRPCLRAAQGAQAAVAARPQVARAVALSSSPLVEYSLLAAQFA